MLCDKLPALLNWKLAKLIGRRKPESAAKRFAAAYKLHPSNTRYALHAVDVLINLRSYQAARSICTEESERDDPVGYWKHFASFVEELERNTGQPVAGSNVMRVAMFNDTDRRPNIGCRLTSQSLKMAVEGAFPGCSIVSDGFRFKAYRAEPTAKPQTEKHQLHQELQQLVKTGYGANAIDHLNDVELVVLQPEGSLDDDVGLHGVLTFCAPILLAALSGKRTIVANGTIPVYKDERAKLLGDIFEIADVAVARDQLSAEAYDIPFVPDAAMLFEPEPYAGGRDGCLITTGARNSKAADTNICVKALEICRKLGLRPVVLSRASDRFAAFRDEIAGMGGTFAETASLKLAAETVSRCRLHVGARYHMAILALSCGVPSLLFNVKTSKNQWLGQFSPLVKLVRIDDGLIEYAREMSAKAGEYPPSRTALSERYMNILQKAANGAPTDKLQLVRAAFNAAAGRR